MNKMLIKLPFDGFYESYYSGAIDHEQEMWAEGEAERREDSSLTMDEYLHIIHECTDYRAVEEAIARDYVRTMEYVIRDAVGFKIKLMYESSTGKHFLPSSGSEAFRIGASTGRSDVDQWVKQNLAVLHDYANQTIDTVAFIQRMRSLATGRG